MAKEKTKKKKEIWFQKPKESFDTTMSDLLLLHNINGGKKLQAMKSLTNVGWLDDGK